MFEDEHDNENDEEIRDGTAKLAFPNYEELLQMPELFRESVRRHAVTHLSQLLYPRLLLRLSKRRKRKRQLLAVHDDSVARQLHPALIRAIPFFALWADPDALAGAAKMRRFEAGEVLCYAGDPSARQHMHVVVAGAVACSSVCVPIDPRWRELGAQHIRIPLKPRPVHRQEFVLDGAIAAKIATAATAREREGPGAVLDPVMAAAAAAATAGQPYWFGELGFLLDLPVLRTLRFKTAGVVFSIDNGAVRDFFAAQTPQVRDAALETALAYRKKLMALRYPMSDSLLLHLLAGVVRAPVKDDVLANMMNGMQTVTLQDKDTIHSATTSILPHRAIAIVLSGKVRIYRRALPSPDSQASHQRHRRPHAGGSHTSHHHHHQRHHHHDEDEEDDSEQFDPATGEAPPTGSLIGVDRLYDAHTSHDVVVRCHSTADVYVVKVLGSLQRRVSDVDEVQAQAAAAAASAPASLDTSLPMSGDASVATNKSAAAERLPLLDEVVELCRADDPNFDVSAAERFKEELRLNGVTHEYPAGCSIVSTSSVADRAIVLKTGVAVVSYNRRKLIHDEAVGYLGAIVPHRWSEHLVAMTEVQTLEFPRATVKRLAKRFGCYKALVTAAKSILFPAVLFHRKGNLCHIAGTIALSTKNPALHFVSEARTEQMAVDRAAGAGPSVAGSSFTSPSRERRTAANEADAADAADAEDAGGATKRRIPQDVHETLMARYRQQIRAAAQAQAQAYDTSNMDKVLQTRSSSRSSGTAAATTAAVAGSPSAAAAAAAAVGSTSTKRNRAAQEAAQREADAALERQLMRFLASNGMSAKYLRDLKDVVALMEAEAAEGDDDDDMGFYDEASSSCFASENASFAGPASEKSSPLFPSASAAAFASTSGAAGASDVRRTGAIAAAAAAAAADAVASSSSGVLASPASVRGAATRVSTADTTRTSSSKASSSIRALVPSRCSSAGAGKSVATQTALSHMATVAKIRDFRNMHRRTAKVEALFATDPHANTADAD